MNIYYTSSFPLNYLRSLPAGSGYLVQYNQLDVRWGMRKRFALWNGTPRSDVDLSEFNVIHLVRTNVFEHALSCYINDNQLRCSSHRGSLKRNTKIDYSQTFSVEPKSMKLIVEKSKKSVRYWLNKVKEDNPKCLTLDYEELYDEQSLTRGWEADEPDVIMPRPAANKICDFLEVSRHDLRSPIKRANTPDYEDYIENWDKIKDLREIIEL